MGNFFEKMGLGFGTVASVVPGVKGAENLVQHDAVPETHIQAPAPVAKDATKDSRTLVWNDKEVNEGNEKMTTVQEALAHVGQGGYVSSLESMKGYVLVAEKIHPGNSEIIQVIAYEVSDKLVNANKIIKIFSDDGEIINENNFKITNRLNEINPVDIFYVYNILMHKNMSPEAILNILQKANPGITKEYIVKILKSNKDYVFGQDPQLAEHVRGLEKEKSSQPETVKETFADVIEDK